MEKPLVIAKEELESLRRTIHNTKLKPFLMVGYNRRFSPHLLKIKESLGKSGPINLVVNMNAGFIEKNHWVHDLEIGGGRIIGEACHLIDVCVFLSEALVEAVCMNNLGLETMNQTDNASILLKLKNGSNAVINYFSNGSKNIVKNVLKYIQMARLGSLMTTRKLLALVQKGLRQLKQELIKDIKINSLNLLIV